MSNDSLDRLVNMTRALGQPHLDYVIIGEGNTSQRIDADTFWVKASGQQMQHIDRSGFVAMRFAPLLDLLDNPPNSAARVQQLMMDARVDTAAPTRPSVEATFHAALLADCGAACIAHTHPTAINQVLCSARAETFARHRLFPDDVVLCGPESVFVPYVDPGLPLAAAIREQVRAYSARYDEPPKVILMANHGLIALAQTHEEALNITAMAVKAAKVFMGACAVGEPVFMSEADVLHIHRRPDEIYRRGLFAASPTL
jgi:rhamnose utilization protein RhaD (predicted bifunctional aldolase and dehydrogenase)